MTATDVESKIDPDLDDRPRPAADEDRWDTVIARVPGGTVYQSSLWARTKGDRTVARRVDIGTGQTGGWAGAQLLVRRVGPLAKAAYVPYGPLYQDRPTVVDEAKPIVAAIEAEARSVGCSVLLIQPARGDQVTAVALQQLGFRPAPVDVATAATLEVELGRDDNELFADLSKSRRQNVRRARRRGVTIEVGERSDLPTLLRLLHGIRAPTRVSTVVSPEPSASVGCAPSRGPYGVADGVGRRSGSWPPAPWCRSVSSPSSN